MNLYGCSAMAYNMVNLHVHVLPKCHWRTALQYVFKQRCTPCSYMNVGKQSTLHASHPRGLCSLSGKHSIYKLSTSHSVLERWTKRINKFESIDEVLNVTQKENLNGNQASVALNIIQNISQKSKHYVAVDKLGTNHLEHLYTVLAKDVTRLTEESIVTSICNVLMLATSSTCRSQGLLKMLAAECRQHLSSLSVHHLAELLCHYKLLTSTKETNALVTEAARAMELRWRELRSPKVVRGLHSSAKYYSPSLIICLENKTLEMMDQFSFVELVQLSKSLSNNNIRSLPILRAIAYQTVEQKGQWEISLILELLNSTCKLSFHHDYLYKDLAQYLKEQLPHCEASTVGNVAQSYALLRIHNSDLLDAIATYTVENFDTIDINDMKNILFAFSQLGYVIHDSDSFTEKIVNKLNIIDFKELPPQVQIDIGFSLAVLKKCPHTLLEQILLDPPDLKDALDVSSQQKVIYQLKLLQLNSYAHLECQSYRGPYLSHLFQYFPHGFHMNSTKLHKNVVQTVEAVVGGPKFCMTDVSLSSGYQLDAVVILKEDATPIAVKNYQQAVYSHFNIIQEFQKPYTRVAIVTWGPSNYLFARKQLVGRSAMAKRHLQLLGFYLVEVPYQKWSTMRSDWERLSFIKHKMTDATKQLTCT